MQVGNNIHCITDYYSFAVNQPPGLSSKFRSILDKVALADFNKSETFFFFFFEEKIPKWPFFKMANSQNFFVKISWIGPWVSRID